MHRFGLDFPPWQSNAIPYREDLTKDVNKIVNYLQKQWLGRGWLDCSECLQQEIVANTIEIYENAFAHGETNIGTFSCGQYYPNLKELKLTIIDFGVGIPFNVRNYLNQPQLSADAALRWSFANGHTTKPNPIPRGIGLNTLKEFVKVNNGQLEVFSHNGYAIIGNNKEIYDNRHSHFAGTLVNITFQCNNCSYSLASEYKVPSSFEGEKKTYEISNQFINW